MNLTELADVPARFLSAGQRRRTALARVIACGVPLWLLDEPTLGLDIQALGALEAALASHRASGGAIVLATHAPLALQNAATLDLANFAVSRAAEPDAL
jgi:heme exporter protein A